jgi:hypothetical protein
VVQAPAAPAPELMTPVAVAAAPQMPAPPLVTSPPVEPAPVFPVIEVAPPAPVAPAPILQPLREPGEGAIFAPASPAAPPPEFAPSKPKRASAARSKQTSGATDSSAPPSDFDPSEFVPKKTFYIVVSYASALTLVLLYLWITGQLGVGNPDLPDIEAPKDRKGRVQSKLMPESQKLPGNHILRLGQSRRYGNIRVTPVQVTRGPLKMVNNSDSNQTKSASREVMKLWVKFENVSSDQTIAPLDRHLLFQRFPDKKNESRVRANNFICPVTQKNRDGNKVMVYEMPIKGDWDLSEDPIGKPLAPGKECEIYIPTNDGDLSKLKGDIVWRLHFRKGYNRSSQRGVTTVVEIRFNTRDVKDDA